MSTPTKRKASQIEGETTPEVGEEESSTTKKKKLFPIFEKSFQTPVGKQYKALQMAMEKAASPPVNKKRKSLFPKKETVGVSQMNLDAGQKQIGPRFCTDCGMLYSPGEPVDEEEHRKAHARLENMFSIKVWKDMRILQPYVDGGFVVLVQCSTDGKNVMNKLKDFLGWMDSELGAGLDTNPCPSRRIFLYVFPSRKKNIIRVFGCAVTEIIDQNKVAAFRILPPRSNKTEVDVEAEDQEQRDIPAKISVGITRLWTDKDFRKRQIASRLCDLARFHSGILGCVVSKDNIGILEPSEDGREFMFRYSQGTGAVYSYIA